MRIYLTGLMNREECGVIADQLRDQGHKVTTPFDVVAEATNPLDAELARRQAVLDVANEDGVIMMPTEWSARLEANEWEQVFAERTWAKKAGMAVLFLDPFIKN